MIDREDYQLPRKQPTKPKRKPDARTLLYLEGLPWRPFDVEW